MRDEDLRMMLHRVHDNITSLQRRVAVAEPKAQAYDALIRVFELTGNNRNMSYEPDITKMLEDEINRVEQRLKEKATTTAGPPPQQQNETPTE